MPSIFESAGENQDEKHGLVKLLTPPFGKDGFDPGYIRAYPPGVRENGGQYTHAACWLLLACIHTGQEARAHRLLKLLAPTAHAATREEADSVQGVLRRHGFVRPEVVVWTDGEYRNLSREPEAGAAVYRVEITGTDALSEAVKQVIAGTAEGRELSRVGQQLFVVGTFENRAVAERLAEALRQADAALEIKVAEVAE